ncbi:MAG TPA: efflux RND transporter permease subunit [Bacteroidales bacterium]|nr:efflux RND transporter permease subunit [Bacteroidales bacterium]
MKKFFLTYKSPVSVIIALIVAGGIFLYSQIKVSLFPEITFPKIKVIAENGEQPVDRMMITVTRPLEEAIKRVPDLKVIRSATSRGSCEISAFLKWDADINVNQQLLESRIAQIRSDLPPEVNITVEKMNPSILPVLGYTIESDTKTPIELNLIATYQIKPFLSQIEGVSQVRIIGGKTKEFRIEPDQLKMSSVGITPLMIRDILSRNYFILSNGYMADNRRLYLTVTDATLNSLEDIGNVVIRNDSKRIIRIKDIAEVKVSEKTEYTRINANGRQGLLVAILKQPNANLINLSENLAEKKKELEKILPPDVRVSLYYDQADFVNETIRSVNDSIWIGLVLAILVAVLFLRSFRASTTILITIPVTLLLTIIVLYSIGYTLNIMTLGAIAAAIGLIIDDAVVVVEQIHRTHEEFPERQSGELVHEAVRYLLPSMIGSSISTIVIFIPFMLLKGVAGAYFNILTNTMVITLICSFVVTWIGLPVVYIWLSQVGSLFPQGRKEVVKHTKTRNWVGFFLKRPAISILVVAGLLGSIVYIIPRLETGFLPEMDEGSIVLDYLSPAGTSLDETDRMCREMEKIISTVPEVEAYSRRTGAEMGFFITEPNKGDYLISLKKNRDRSTEEVIDDIRKKIEKSQPAMTVDFGQVIGDMLGDLMESVQPVEIKIFGSEQEQLRKLSEEVREEVDRIKGVEDVFNGIVIAGPSIEVVPDQAGLARFGISPESFQFQMQTMVEGNIVSSVKEREQLTSVRLIYPNSNVNSLERMENSYVFLPDGRLKPLSGLASIRMKGGVAEIIRENLKSVSIVTARLNSRDLGSAMREVKENIRKNVNIPSGYHIEYGGAYADQQKSFRELLVILVLASLLVFTLMLFLFRDFRAACAILFIAVLGLSGSLIALKITGTALNVGSYTGLIMIVGIIGENAIFTFQQFMTNRKTGTVDDSLVFAISTRLRPKLMTALGAIIALSPLAFGIGTGAQMHQPLAIAVIGGFIIALPLLLIVFPSILHLIYRDKNQEVQGDEGQPATTII